jgi:hypothetical protein
VPTHLVMSTALHSVRESLTLLARPVKEVGPLRGAWRVVAVCRDAAETLATLEGEDERDARDGERLPVYAALGVVLPTFDDVLHDAPAAACAGVGAAASPLDVVLVPLDRRLPWGAVVLTEAALAGPRAAWAAALRELEPSSTAWTNLVRRSVVRAPLWSALQRRAVAAGWSAPPPVGDADWRLALVGARPGSAEWDALAHSARCADDLAEHAAWWPRTGAELEALGFVRAADGSWGRVTVHGGANGGGQSAAREGGEGPGARDEA